ncbi:MAG TPA: mannosyltransferase family protein [Candidatus Limnocylindrales bacterium]|nr:mannosyltransferase family protein [Candidatus Limnocylindrales bacterium]
MRPPREQLDARVFPGWLEAIAIGIASRVFSVAFLVGAWALHWPPVGWASFDNPFVIWDGSWYTFIAANGYHAGAVVPSQYGPGLHDFAFFPAWPMLLRALSLGNQLPMDVVAPLAANVLFLVATIPIFAVLERVGGRTFARWGLALFAFSPAGYVYSLAYSEPLYLVLAGLFFLAVGRQATAARTRSTVGAVIFAAGTQLVRVTGAALAFASLPDLLRSQTRPRGLLVIGACIAAFAAWWLWIANLTGDFWGYLLGTPSWFLNQRPTPIATGIASFFDPGLSLWWTSAIAIGLIVVLTLGTRWLWRQGEMRLALFSLACIASTMLDTQTTMPRLASIAFPAFAGLAAILPSDRWRWAALLGFAGLQGYYAANVVQRLVVP